LHPSDVGIGAQYDPVTITGLRRLTHYSITSRVCNFSAFINLVEVDISHNKLTDVLTMGLQGHQHLRVLCATHNAITTPLSKIAPLLDSIPHLEVVCLRENPIMRTAEDRMKLLGYLHSQRVFLPVLRVFDTEITLDERITAWKRAECVDDEPERLRFAVVIQSLLLNQPLVPQQTALTSLDLSHADLAFVNLAQFVHLRELNLLGNRIESLDSCVGMAELKLLEVLDLRFNLLARLEAIAALVAQLPLLETLGLIGNRCAPTNTAMASLRDLATAAPSYRVRFLSLVPDALRVRGHSLAVLDSKEITIDERAQACRPDAASMALISASLPNLQQQQQLDRNEKRTSTLGSMF
jgi:Leucine-rich repeat (LRR) protein